MKQIDNEYHEKLCEVLEKYYGGAVEKCSATMKEASLDDSNKEDKVYVYNYDDYDMEVLKLDEFSELLAKKRKNSGHKKLTIPAVDAVCIDSENNWYLIEFKNQKLNNAKNSIKEKALNSLWLLLYTYSVTDNISCILDGDIIKFAKEHIIYIIVCNQDKNRDIANAIHMKEERNEHYTPNILDQYIDFCFKDAYIYTEQELREFILNFK